MVFFGGRPASQFYVICERRKNMNWKKFNTLSHQIREGKPVSSSFSWCKDEEENIHIKSNKTKKYSHHMTTVQC